MSTAPPILGSTEPVMLATLVTLSFSTRPAFPAICLLGEGGGGHSRRNRDSPATPGTTHSNNPGSRSALSVCVSCGSRALYIRTNPVAAPQSSSRLHVGAPPICAFTRRKAASGGGFRAPCTKASGVVHFVIVQRHARMQHPHARATTCELAKILRWLSWLRSSVEVEGVEPPHAAQGVRMRGVWA